MKRILFLLLLTANVLQAQTADTASKILWGFPITSYMVALQPGVDVVQIILPSSIKFVQGKQLGVLRGVASGANIDTGNKGWGKCHLIKGEYHYFAIHLDSITKAKPKEGDLLYTFIPRQTAGYLSPVFYCAAHGVTFLTVTDTAFYKPADFLNKRSKAQDDALLEKMVKDVQYTGRYILAEHPEMNREIAEGPYKGKKMLEFMMVAEQTDVIAFLRYVAARPRRYAGNNWKISETFATWLVSGAPTVK